jgi:hypothetical protein
MRNDPMNIGENHGASVETTDALSTSEPVSRPRDPVTGVFVSKHPRDPELAAEIERWGRELDAEYPNATRALRDAAKLAHAMTLRLARPAESGGAVRPTGRVPRVIVEAGNWMDKLTRLIESLEATNAKRGGKTGAPRTDLNALMEAQRRAAQR